MAEATFAVGAGKQVLIGFAVIAVKHGEVEVTRWLKSHSDNPREMLEYWCLKGCAVGAVAHGSLAKQGEIPFDVLEVDAVGGELLSLEIVLIVMCWLGLQRYAEPGVVSCIADFEMGGGVGKVPARHLLADGVTVKQFSGGAVIASLLQAADELCFVQTVGHADVGVDEAVAVEHRAFDRADGKGGGCSAHEQRLVGRAFRADAATLFHHAAARKGLAEVDSRPHRKPLAESQLIVACNGSFYDT